MSVGSLTGSLSIRLPNMSETKISRRGRGEDAIYFATAKNRYVGSVSLGFGPDGKRIRRKVFGRTKQEVREKLKALHQELNTADRKSTRLNSSHMSISYAVFC